MSRTIPQSLKDAFQAAWMEGFNQAQDGGESWADAGDDHAHDFIVGALSDGDTLLWVQRALATAR